MRRIWHRIDFRAEVIEYIEDLSDKEKVVFEELYTNLINYGRDLKWIYFALETLGTRSVIGSKGLFYNNSFCEEIYSKIISYDEGRLKEAKKLISKDISEFNYTNILIPAYMGKEREYAPSNLLKCKLKKLYGEEAFPQELLDLMQSAQTKED